MLGIRKSFENFQLSIALVPLLCSICAACESDRPGSHLGALPSNNIAPADASLNSATYARYRPYYAGMPIGTCYAREADDAGYPRSDVLYDFNGDGCLDFAREVGNFGAVKIKVTYSGRVGSALTPDTWVDLGNIRMDWAYLWEDVDKNGLIDFCYLVGRYQTITQMNCRDISPKGGGVEKTLNVNAGPLTRP